MRRPGSPLFGFSILTTSAPSHASASVQVGPASNWVKSTTRTPLRQLSGAKFPLILKSPPTTADPAGTAFTKDTAEAHSTETADFANTPALHLAERDSLPPSPRPGAFPGMA